MIYEKILALCKSRGVTIHAVERACGIGNGVIGGWREKTPRVDILHAVANYFGVTVDYFLREAKEEK